MRIRVIRDFLQLESASGIILFAMTAIALILSNCPLASVYQKFFQEPLIIHFANVEIIKPLLFWINEGLMTLFFLLVGLEIKREFVGGELSKWSQIVLPAVAAIGGMVVPALIYLFVNNGDLFRVQGWAIPVATDIAFALGVLSLFGRRVPFGLKLFLMALAIFDDIGAILIIAVFHTQALSYWSLLFAGLLIMFMAILNRFGVKHSIPYILIGIVLWCCVLESGVHATVAGIILAMMIPQAKQGSVLLEEKLHPWVAFLIMPLFALANAGISFSGVTSHIVADTVTVGVVLGLFFGKQLGVLSFAWLVIKLRWAKMPNGTHWASLYGVALLCGIGFTMSLFLGTLAFQGSNELLTEVRLGVLAGSVLSGIAGSTVLYFSLWKGNDKVESQ